MYKYIALLSLSALPAFAFQTTCHIEDPAANRYRCEADQYLIIDPMETVTYDDDRSVNLENKNGQNKSTFYCDGRTTEFIFDTTIHGYVCKAL